MDYYKKYRIIENTRLANDINHIIHFFHKLPLVGKYTGDKYKGYGFKTVSYTHLTLPTTPYV